MKLKEKTERWQQGKTFVGRKKNYVVTISFSPTDFTGKKDYWYFLIEKKRYRLQI